MRQRKVFIEIAQVHLVALDQIAYRNAAQVNILEFMLVRVILRGHRRLQIPGICDVVTVLGLGFAIKDQGNFEPDRKSRGDDPLADNEWLERVQKIFKRQSGQKPVDILVRPDGYVVVEPEPAIEILFFRCRYKSSAAR